MRFGITFTGIDERTACRHLPGGAEYGILFTEKPEGRHRYPSRRAAWRILEYLANGRTSLHVCGRGARRLLSSYGIPDLTHLVKRIQVNGEPSPEEVTELCDMYGDHEIITQHTHRNIDLLSVKADNHSVLVDGSGGRGISPGGWAAPVTHKRVGFAGGLGADNIAMERESIRKVAKSGAWLDMEGKIRDNDDWCSVDKIYEVVRELGGI